MLEKTNKQNVKNLAAENPPATQGKVQKARGNKNSRAAGGGGGRQVEGAKAIPQQKTASVTVSQ